MGYNFEPSEIMAAYGLVQMDKLADFNARRQHNFRALDDVLAGHDDIVTAAAHHATTSTPRGCATRSCSPTVSIAPLRRSSCSARDIPTRMIWTGNILRQPGFAGIAAPCARRRTARTPIG